MITAEEVIRRIEMYFDGGTVDYLTDEQAAVCMATLAAFEGAECPAASR